MSSVHDFDEPPATDEEGRMAFVIQVTRLIGKSVGFATVNHLDHTFLLPKSLLRVQGHTNWDQIDVGDRLCVSILAYLAKEKGIV